MSSGRTSLRVARVALVCAAGACLGTPDASFQLDVPQAIASEAAWYEIGLFPGSCPPDALLAGGIPQQGTFGRLAFAASAKSPPGLGTLPTQTYGIAAVARTANCTVVGTGCAATSVSGSGALTVSISPVSGEPGGACASGSVCVDAECIPSADAGVADGAASPSTGEACTLQLVGQGPLADPLGQDSTLLSAPAITATPIGFLIAYREFDPSLGTARLTTIAVSPAGASATPTQLTLQDTCTGSPETDATGLTFTGSQGTIAVSQPACAYTEEPDAGTAPGDGGEPEGGDPGGGAPEGGEPDGGETEPVDAGTTPGGLVLFTVDPTGSVTDTEFTQAAGDNVQLGQGHALAVTPGGVVLAYTDPLTQASFAATLSGASIMTSPGPVPFSTFGVMSDSSAYVVGTSYGLGLLAVASSGGTSAAILATQAGNGSLGFGSTFSAQWAAASGAGSRILVASSGAGASSILWSAFDLGNGSAPATHTGTFSPANGGAVSFADVAMVGDHAYFAAEVDDSISLFAFEKASTSPILLGELPFSSQPVIPVGELTGGLVAVAASESRIAVVWGTGPTLQSNDAVGGYAVFTCAP